MYLKYLNRKAESQILKWEKDFCVTIEVSRPCKTRLGVFIPKHNGKNLIKINQDLNQYSFLITLVHELAHASIWNKYGRRVKPHGDEWKKEFQKMMLRFLTPEYFPDDILKALSFHMINPKATTVRDINLTEILMSYNDQDIITINSLEDGVSFKTSDGREFKKIEKMRKNYKCMDLKSGKIYRFSPLAVVYPL